MPHKKLYRSRENAMIGGVCAGLAEYFNIDPSLTRLATVLLIFPGGVSFWAYIVAWIIIPQKPLGEITSESTEAAEDETEQAGDEMKVEKDQQGDKTRFVAGIILVALGLFFLMNTLNIFVWFSFFKLWPIVLIVIGAVILIRGLEKGGGNES